MQGRGWIPRLPIERGNRGPWIALMVLHMLTWIVVRAHDQGLELFRQPIEACRQLSSGPNVTLFGFWMAMYVLLLCRPWQRLMRGIPEGVREGAFVGVMVRVGCGLLCVELTLLACQAQGLGLAMRASPSIGRFVVSDVVTSGVLAALGFWLWARADSLERESGHRGLPASSQVWKCFAAPQIASRFRERMRSRRGAR